MWRLLESPRGIVYLNDGALSPARAVAARHPGEVGALFVGVDDQAVAGDRKARDCLGQPGL